MIGYSSKGGRLKKVKQDGAFPVMKQDQQWQDNPIGRFPSNLIHDGSNEIMKKFEKVGISKSAGGDGSKFDVSRRTTYYLSPITKIGGLGFGDIGSVARYFYQAKTKEKLIEYLSKMISIQNGINLILTNK